MKITQKDIGRWATIKFDDVGRRDVLIVDVQSDFKYIEVFEPTRGLHTVTSDYFLELREMQKAA